MAKITNAALTITEELPAGKSVVKVTCRVKFSPLDVNLMRSGLGYRLNCRIWGEDWGQDSWIDPDNSLFSFESKRYPDINPTPNEDVTFETKINTSILNEDSGTDEIYGQLTLSNNFNSDKIRKKTNVIIHKF